MSHVGAGVDSFIEYAFKVHLPPSSPAERIDLTSPAPRPPSQAYILTGEDGYYDVFAEFYGGVMSHVRDESGFWVRHLLLLPDACRASSDALYFPHSTEVRPSRPASGWA